MCHDLCAQDEYGWPKIMSELGMVCSLINGEPIVSELEVPKAVVGWWDCGIHQHALLTAFKDLALLTTN